jgi:hypothetical protein
MNTKITVVLVAVISLWAWPGPAKAVLPPAGYIYETYASYYHPGAGAAPWWMTFDGYGNLYVTHKEDGSIYRISPDGTAERWLDKLNSPREIIWAGQTPYGDYLYLASPNGHIYKIDPDRNSSVFATVPGGDIEPLALDRYARYGGYMYTATRSNDHMEGVLPNGQTTRFSDFPYGISGGVGGIAFDPGMEYGGFMHAASESKTSPQWNGLFRLDIFGNPTRFGSNRIITAKHLEFDTVGLMFDGKLFVVGEISTGVGTTFWGIYEVFPNGEPTPFWGGTRQTGGVYGFTFGPDGALYVAGYVTAENTVVITRITLPPKAIAARKLLAAIAEKKTAIERIESAIAKELAAIEALDELLESGDLGELQIDDILRTRQRTNAAIQQQRASIQILRISIRRLEAVLADLGCSAEDQTQAGPGRR